METTSATVIKCIAVLSGIPGCGKTTLAGLLHKKLNIVMSANNSAGDETAECLTGVKELGVVVISYDDLIPEDIKFEDDTQQTWKVCREEVVLCVDTLLNLSSFSFDKISKPSSDISVAFWEKFSGILQKQQTSAKAIVLVIDDNMYYSSMRYRYYQLARKYTCGFCQLSLTCSVEDALKRNSQRKHPIPNDVIVNMATKIEMPNKLENSWETNSMVIDSQNNFESYLGNIAKLVMSAIMNPVQPVEEIDPAVAEESRQICSSNVLHQCDQILRKTVSQKMLDLKGMLLSKDAKQTLSKKYLNARKLCIERIKTGQVKFPLMVTEPNFSMDKNNELNQQVVKLFEQIIKEIT